MRSDYDIHLVPTLTHGRVLLRKAREVPRGVLVGFHGYMEDAETQMRRLEAIPAASHWTLVSIQGLHRVCRGRTTEVVASWMTRQDRDVAIADNIEYVNAALDGVPLEASTKVVYGGFSQGVATAFRSAVRGPHAAAGIIGVGGDVPPELCWIPTRRFHSFFWCGPASSSLAQGSPRSRPVGPRRAGAPACARTLRRAADPERPGARSRRRARCGRRPADRDVSRSLARASNAPRVRRVIRFADRWSCHMSNNRFGRRDLLKIAALTSLAPVGAKAQAPQATGIEPSEARRRELYAMLGELPGRTRPISAKKRGEEQRDSYVLERWELDLNGLEPVPAYVARPVALKGRAPAVLFNHSHGGGYKIGKQEFVDGRSYLQPEPYARTLTDLGCVALAIDHWVFGERSHTTEADMFKAMLWRGQVLWGMMVYDSLRALDWLVERSDVDAARVGTMGISMGSTMAWWLAALDERVKVTVDICCLTDFHTLLAKKGLSLHGLYYYVPGLVNRFTTSQINALIAPRAHLGLAGLQDKLTPVEGLDIIDRELTKVYAAAGHTERWKLLRYDVGHMETPEGRREIIAWMKRFL